MTPAGGQDAAARRAMLIRRETGISVVVNAVLGILFALIVFGRNAASATALAIDFLPQTFMMVFLGGTIPALLMRKRIAAGDVMPVGPTPTLRGLLRRILWCALGSTVLFGAIGAMMLFASGIKLLQPSAVFAMKAAYGGIVGLIVTPPIMRMVLGMAFLPTTRRDSLPGVQP